MENLLDMELVRLAQKGEARAFDILVKRYQTKVMHLVFRYVNDKDTALDLVQDIFFKIFRNLVKFKGEAKFSSWLFRIAVNDCIDHQRRLKVRKEHSLDQFREFGFDVVEDRAEADLEGSYEANDQRAYLRGILQRLPQKQIDVVVMKIYQDMTFDEISDILGQPVSTVKSRLYKALHTLGGELRRCKVIEGSKG